MGEPIPHYKVKHGRAYWEPKPAALLRAGAEAIHLKARPLGIAGAETEAAARALAHRLAIAGRGGIVEEEIAPAAPGPEGRPGTIAHAWHTYRASKLWGQERSLRTREEWERCWKQIEPTFGDAFPADVTMFALAEWRDLITEKISAREAHRCVKIWRALWVVMEAMGYCNGRTDPSKGFENPTPPVRTATWAEWEIARIAKRAWRERYYGLAALLAVAWDGLMSPVDARTLTMAQGRKLGGGAYVWEISRAKTGVDALAPMTRRGARMLKAYLAFRGEVADDEPIFQTQGYAPAPGSKGGRPRGSVPYLRNSLCHDFRLVRAMVFPGDERKLSDIRRSGTSEAFAGAADAKGMADVLGNSIDKNKALQKTYAPAQAATVIPIMDARRLGRQRQRAAAADDAKEAASSAAAASA